MNEQMNELREIALELLSKYEYAQMNVLWEVSFNIEDDENDLNEEIEEYRDQIEMACKGELCQDVWSISEYDEKCYEEYCNEEYEEYRISKPNRRKYR